MMISHKLFWVGHGFSRAAPLQKARALAPEGPTESSQELMRLVLELRSRLISYTELNRRRREGHEFTRAASISEPVIAL